MATEIERLEKIVCKLDMQIRFVEELDVDMLEQRVTIANISAHLVDLVTTDDLTGLKNCRYFRETLEQLLAARRAFPLSIIMATLESDRPSGDAVTNDELRSIAGLFSQSIRHFDVLARHDTRTIIMLLQNTDEWRACDLAKQMRQNLIHFTSSGDAVVARFGISTQRHENYSSNRLIDEAARALRNSHNAGMGTGILHFHTLSCGTIADMPIDEPTSDAVTFDRSPKP